MAYARYYTTWKDDPDITTPVVAAFLQALEDFLVTVTAGGIASPSSPTTNDALLYNGSAWTNGKVANANIDPAAAIAYGKLALSNSIVNGDINSAAAIAYSKLALAASVVNGDISPSAAIAYSKLALTGAVVNADIATSAAIAYSKLNLAASVVNADIASAAAIAYSKLNLTGSIVNADISASAAIAKNKLASLAIVDADVSSISASKITGAIGTIVAYQEFTSVINVASTTESSGTTIVTAPAFTADGTSSYWIEFYADVSTPTTGAGSFTICSIFEGATQIGRITDLRSPTAGQVQQTQIGRRKLTPTAASHTYSITAFSSSTTGTPQVIAGAGGTSTFVPGYICIEKAS